MSNQTETQPVEAPTPGADLKALGDRLVGTWVISGEAEGETTWEWMEGGFFLLQRGWTHREGAEQKYLQVIGHDRLFGVERAEAITGRLYTDHGDTLTYVCELDGDTMTIWVEEKGSPAVYTGMFSADGNMIEGAWIWPGGGYKETMTRDVGAADQYGPRAEDPPLPGGARGRIRERGPRGDRSGVGGNRQPVASLGQPCHAGGSRTDRQAPTCRAAHALSPRPLRRADGACRRRHSNHRPARRKHCFLAEGFYERWLANIADLRERFPDDVVLHVGHGGPAGHEDFEWQRRYIEIFVDTVEAADWSEPDTAHAAVVDRMNEYLPSDELQFLMELSVEPIAAQLQLTAGARR